jgi:hypothetical protein
MPEAVDSNSIPVARYKRARLEVEDIFSSPSIMIKAFQEMTCIVVADREDHRDLADGLHLIHELLMRELDEAVEKAREYAGNLTISSPAGSSRQMITPIDPELFGRIGELVDNAIGRTEADEDGSAYVVKTTEYYNELLARLDGETDLIEAASMLPWLELKITRDLADQDAFERALTRLSTFERDQHRGENRQAV